MNDDLEGTGLPENTVRVCEAVREYRTVYVHDETYDDAVFHSEAWRNPKVKSIGYFDGRIQASVSFHELRAKIGGKYVYFNQEDVDATTMAAIPNSHWNVLVPSGSVSGDGCSVVSPAAPPPAAPSPTPSLPLPQRPRPSARTRLLSG